MKYPLFAMKATRPAGASGFWDGLGRTFDWAGRGSRFQEIRDQVRSRDGVARSWQRVGAILSSVESREAVKRGTSGHVVLPPLEPHPPAAYKSRHVTGKRRARRI